MVDLQVGVRSLADCDTTAFVKALADKGFPRIGGDQYNCDDALPWIDDVTLWQKRFHGSADPARIVHLHLREIDGPGWRYALLFRDWLREEAQERDAYAVLKGELARSRTTTTDYTEAKGPWIVGALARADAWARRTGWSAR